MKNSKRRGDGRFYVLSCIGCGRRCREEEPSTRCPSCGRPLTVRYDWSYIKSRLNRYALRTSPIKALKYLDFYPILNLDLVVSLDEGGTPLYRCHRSAQELGLRALYIKNEGMNPTGVFKDWGRPTPPLPASPATSSSPRGRPSGSSPRPSPTVPVCFRSVEPTTTRPA